MEKNSVLKNGQRIALKNDGVMCTTKGVHTFTVCDARSEKAQKLSERCNAFSIPFAKLKYEKDKLQMPINLRLSFLNKCAAELQRKDPLLEEEQASLIAEKEKIGEHFKRLFHALWLEYRDMIGQLEQNFKLREVVIENITTTVGRAVLAQRLGGDTTYTGTVNYTALGSNNTAAVVGDATLGTEVYRKALSSGTDASNISYLETFFTAAETSGTYEEYGMFIDGTGSANTGQLFNRFVSTIVKSVTETLNVQSVITINDA